MHIVNKDKPSRILTTFKRRHENHLKVKKRGKIQGIFIFQGFFSRFLKIPAFLLPTYKSVHIYTDEHTHTLYLST